MSFTLIHEIEINRQAQLGEGGFSLVFLGRFGGRQVAVKRVELRNASDKEEKVLKLLDHPNVIKFFHSESDADFKYFALELCHASLDQLFPKSGTPKKYNGPELPSHLTVFLQLAWGLKYIHSRNFIHRDIKPANVLISVDSAGLAKIKWADFGLSRSVNERGTCTLSGIKGTLHWFAPELLRSLERNPEEPGRGTVKSDVFALALVFGYILLDGKHLYGSNESISKNIKEKNLVNMDSIDDIEDDIDDLDCARVLLLKMLADEPRERISSLEIVNELNSIKTKIEQRKKEKTLWTLCQEKSLDIKKIKFLIHHGIDVNGKDDNGWNALHHLCRNNSSEKLIDAIQLLIQLGINVIGKDDAGWNALHFLCRFNSSEKLLDAIKILIQEGIDVKEKDKDGRNVLHHLCRNNSSEKLIDVIELLIERGIDVNEKNNHEWNALHLLCRYNSSEKLIDAIKILIQHGIDVNEKNHFRLTALHFLCQYNSSENFIDAIKLLIKYEIYVKGRDNDGRNALHLLCEYNSSEKLIDVIELLIERGIDVNEKNNHEWNALHLLCRYNSNEKLNNAIEILLQRGSNVNAKTNDGWNALHYLCRYNSSDKLIDAIKLLIKTGIVGKSNGINAQSLLQDNPQYAKNNNIEEIIQYLDKAAVSYQVD